LDKKERLKTVIREKALRFGEFVLASGKKSNYYLNGKMVTLDSEGLYLTAELIFQIVRELRVQAIGGPTIGADPIVGAVLAIAAMNGYKLDGFLVRKEAKDHGTKSLIEGPLKEGSKVLMVEDVVTTAGTCLKAAEALKAHRCEIMAMVCLIDRQEGAGENLAKAGYLFSPLFLREDFGL